MLKREERLNKLNNAGVNTEKYFTFELPKDYAAGTTVKIVFDENGVPQMETNVVYEQIIEDGYVRNTKLHRRWITAQTFRMLNYKSWNRREEGYNAALKNFGYNYTFQMMLEEVRVLGKLQERDVESFNERVHFFDKDVVVAVCEDYVDKLKAYVDKLQTKNCKGVPYKRIKGKDIFVEDLHKKLYAPIETKIRRMIYETNYTKLYRLLRDFIKNMIKLDWTTPKSKAWVDAYKGAGAYYTCKNLIMFHDCRVKEGGLYDSCFHNRDKSMEILTSNLTKYKGEGWRMFAFMKKLIEDNHFDFDAKMKKIYNK